MLRKDNLSMDQYIEQAKELFDLISATGYSVPLREQSYI